MNVATVELVTTWNPTGILLAAPDPTSASPMMLFSVQGSCPMNSAWLPGYLSHPVGFRRATE